jgi:hypothetical protein
MEEKAEWEISHLIYHLSIVSPSGAVVRHFDEQISRVEMHFFTRLHIANLNGSGKGGIGGENGEVEQRVGGGPSGKSLNSKGGSAQTVASKKGASSVNTNIMARCRCMPKFGPSQMQRAAVKNWPEQGCALAGGHGFRSVPAAHAGNTGGRRQTTE